MDVLPPTDASSLQDFHAKGEEKTLALAWALQASVEELGFPTGILHDSARELQKCMAPLMTLSSDDIVETSLLKSMEDKHGTPLALEEEAALLEEEINSPLSPGSSQESAKWSTAPSISFPSLVPPADCHLLWRPRSLGSEPRLIWIILVDGFFLTSRKMTECLHGGESSGHTSPPWMKVLAMTQSKEWPASKPWTSGCQPHKWNERAHGLPHPAWHHLGKEISFPQKDFKGAWDYWVVLAEETVALAKTIQRCAVCFGMPLGVIFRTVQELHEGLAPIVQSSDLLDLGMLDVAEKDPVVPASEGRSSSLIPWVEPPIGLTAPSELCASEPEGAA